jgi:hypothetical protein
MKSIGLHNPERGFIVPIPVVTNDFGTVMVVADATSDLLNHFSDDEVLAIRYALRDRADVVRQTPHTAKYADFLDLIGMKLASLQDLDC